ncbi:MAG: sensor histidine kinase [Paenibacillaceae bacterium]
MNTIRKKIILLSLCSWVIMAGIWFALTLYNQSSIEKYNQILQKYLSMNKISQLSSSAVIWMKHYLDEHLQNDRSEYHSIKDQLQQAKFNLVLLENKNNENLLANYAGMIESQIEAMDLTIRSEQMNDRDEVKRNFDEATNISKYISEETLTLLSTELATHDQFYQSIIEESNNLRKMGFWTMAMASCVLLLFSYRFADGITRPILALSLAAKKIAQGNFDNPVEIVSNDEISFLGRTFNHMRLNIKQSILEIQDNAQLENELQEHKLRLKENELKSLQSQINPHFLFNTLNILAKKAYLEGAEETSDLISSVAGLLRYNLKRLDSPVTLRDELRILDEYLIIQKARFMDRVQVRKEVDEACLSIHMPNLTIQPFVENAFIHAIEPSEIGGCITIRTYSQEDAVIVEIADDGIGIMEERLKAILEDSDEGREKGHSSGIGIGNVVDRLRLFYGVKDVVQITSSPGVGTCVKLILPFQKGV